MIEAAMIWCCTYALSIVHKNGNSFFVTCFVLKVLLAYVSYAFSFFHSTFNICVLPWWSFTPRKTPLEKTVVYPNDQIQFISIPLGRSATEVNMSFFLLLYSFHDLCAPSGTIQLCVTYYFKKENTIPTLKISHIGCTVRIRYRIMSFHFWGKSSNHNGILQNVALEILSSFSF